MNVGIDLDNTITDIPWLFACLIKGLEANGHQIHIITFRENRELTIKELSESGISYHMLHTPTDRDRLPPQWKAKIAKQFNINVMIDDSPEVLDAMPKDVATLWMIDRSVFDLQGCIAGAKARAKMNIIG